MNISVNEDCQVLGSGGESLYMDLEFAIKTVDRLAYLGR